jgi:hypothetical protein
VLSNIVQNASSAISKAIEWCGLYMSSDGGEFAINQDFYDKSSDPSQLMAEVQLLDRGVIAKLDMRAKLRKTGVIHPDRTDDEIDAETGDASPI